MNLTKKNGSLLRYSAFIVLCSISFMHLLEAQHVETDDVVLMTLLKERAALSAFRQPWRAVQERAKDTVVQIFAQVAEIDLLQPYQTPAQYGKRGTGFFINEKGDIITNAHVVEEAVALCIQVPCSGKQLFDVEIVGVCPERDLALLRLSSEGHAFLINTLGALPFLPLGDSDTIRRSDEVLALGYPLGQESLKSTTGVISGQEGHYIQISAPINPGNSGGPLLNAQGEVIGINSAGITEAQNVGYSIPVNDLQVILKDLYVHPIVRKPYLGIIAINATPELTSYCGNPKPGGAYIIDVLPDSPLSKADIRINDMIYSINNCELDMYCQIRAPWSEEKISVIDYISRLATGDIVNLVLYRNGQRIEKTVVFDGLEVAPIRKIYPGYESIDYEVFGGMVVMELSVNHIKLLKDKAPGLAQFYERKNQMQPQVIITHIFANSQLYRTRTLTPGATIREINGQPVATLADFRAALAAHQSDYFTIKASDNTSHVSDNFFVVLSFEKLIAENKELARIYHYPISEAIKKLER